jgi:nucleotide-binding universal stress UspA family protein
MLPKIRKILYVTDMSYNSRLAFSYAASLTKQFNADLMVLHAIEPVNPYTHSHISGMMGEAEWVNIQMDFENKMVDDLGTKLREFCNHLQTSSEEIKLKDEHLLVRKGVSVDVILDVSRELEADLIVMGTHGYGMVKDALMGGTARRIVRRSEIPVMVVRSMEEG